MFYHITFTYIFGSSLSDTINFRVKRSFDSFDDCQAWTITTATRLTASFEVPVNYKIRKART